MPRSITTHPCRKYKIEGVNKREIKAKVKVPIHKVQRSKKNKTHFLVTTKKNESVRKMKSFFPESISITMGTNSAKYDIERSPSHQYQETNLDSESWSCCHATAAQSLEDNRSGGSYQQIQQLQEENKTLRTQIEQLAQKFDEQNKKIEQQAVIQSQQNIIAQQQLQQIERLQNSQQQMQQKLQQYESHQFDDTNILFGLTALKNYLDQDVVKKKAQKWLSKLKKQKYNQTQLAKECEHISDIEEQALIDVLNKCTELLSTAATALPSLHHKTRTKQ